MGTIGTGHEWHVYDDLLFEHNTKQTIVEVENENRLLKQQVNELSRRVSAQNSQIIELIDDAVVHDIRFACLYVSICRINPCVAPFCDYCALIMSSWHIC